MSARCRDVIDYLPERQDEVARVRKSVAPLRWDVGMGAIVLFIVTAAFMISGAAVLYPLQSDSRAGDCSPSSATCGATSTAR